MFHTFGTHLASNRMPHLELGQPHERGAHNLDHYQEAPKYMQRHLTFEEPRAGNPRIIAQHDRIPAKECRQSPPPRRLRQDDHWDIARNVIVDNPRMWWQVGP